jgi:hypothetical protein
MDVLNVISIILAIVCAGAIVWIGIKTNILRESSLPGSPYSWSRFQLWLWTLVISPLFILYWGFEAQSMPELNDTCLILLGISVGGTLISGIVSSVLDSYIKKDKDGNPVDEKGNLLGIKAPLKKYQDSKSFWADILMDDNGQFSITRLQQFIFTLAYALVFISSFFSEMDYPDFQSNAFILMGISTGTYLVGKGMKR